MSTTRDLDFETQLSKNNTPTIIKELPQTLQEHQQIMNNKTQFDESDNIPSIPWKPLLLVFFMFSVDVLSFSSLMPYVASLVQDLQLVSPNDTHSIGYYASVIGSSYYFAQFISASFWGYISDRYGRRLVLLTGIFGGFLTSLLFGFSKSLWWALVTRIFFGLVNGNLGAYKVYISEVTHKKHHAQVFSYISLSVSLGTVLGPAIGGFLSNPVDQYPRLALQFPSLIVRILRYYPFLLPNAFISCIQLGSFIIAYHYLKESNQKVIEAQSNGYVPLATSESETNKGDNNRKKNKGRKSSKFSLLSSEENNQLEDIVVEMDEIVNTEQQQGVKQVQKKEETTVEPLHAKLSASTSSMTIVSSNKNSVLSCFLYCLIGFVNIAFAECMPLFLVLDAQFGGLGFTKKQIGIQSSITGCMMIIFQLLLCARIMKRFGLLNTMKYCSLILALTVQLYPSIHRFKLVDSSFGVWAMLVLVNLLRFSAIQTSFSSTNIMLNNSVVPHHRGKLNGAAQSMVAFGRAVAPLMGIVFAMSIAASKNSSSYIFNIRFIFHIMTVTHLCCLGLCFLMNGDINEPKMPMHKSSVHEQRIPQSLP